MLRVGACIFCCMYMVLRVDNNDSIIIKFSERWPTHIPFGNFTPYRLTPGLQPGSIMRISIGWSFHHNPACISRMHLPTIDYLFDAQPDDVFDRLASPPTQNAPALLPQFRRLIVSNIGASASFLQIAQSRPIALGSRSAPVSERFSLR